MSRFWYGKKARKHQAPNHKYSLVVSVAEYHRRIDALNTEELRTLCRRLKVPSSVVTPFPGKPPFAS